MNPALVTSLLSILASLLPGHPTLVQLSQHGSDVAQVVGALGSLISTVWLWLSRPHERARAFVLRLLQRIRAWFVPRVVPPSVPPSTPPSQ